MPGTSEPRADRPDIPAEYGTSSATEFVEWRHVEERLARDRVVWVATVSASGRPRVRPVDSLYVDGMVFIAGSPEVRWIRELTENPNVSIHLDGVDDVIIVEGQAEVRRTIDNDLAERLAAASQAKFPEYGMTAKFYKIHGAIAIHARKVIAWTHIARDPTRFRFGQI